MTRAPLENNTSKEMLLAWVFLAVGIALAIAAVVVCALKARGRSRERDFVAVVAHYDESIEWLQNTSFPVVFCSKQKIPEADPTCSYPENIADQHLHFVQWIIANYDNLPKHIVFMDAHERDHHTNYDMVEYLTCLTRHLDRIPADVYHPLNQADEQNRDAILLDTAESTKQRLETLGEWGVKLRTLLGLPPDIPELGHHCCATFLVSRSRIVARSLEFWRSLAKILAEGKPPSHGDLSYCMEYLWHVILGEPMKVTDRVPVLCTEECGHLRRQRRT